MTDARDDRDDARATAAAGEDAERRQEPAEHAMAPGDFAAHVEGGGYDFLDFGCSDGNGLIAGQRIFGGRKGLGIDIMPDKVAAARRRGLDAVLFDIEEIPDRKMVNFVSLAHFLEHVPDIAMAKRFVEKACRVARRFVFIRQPFFDADGYLLARGLKLFWSDWTGHPHKMNTLDALILARDLRNRGLVDNFSVGARDPIRSSDDERVLPLDAPKDQLRYDIEKHGPKPQGVQFSEPVFYEIVIALGIDGAPSADIARRYRCNHIFASG